MVELADLFFKDLVTTREQKSRFLSQLIPVQTICMAKEDDLRDSAKKLVDTYFPTDQKDKLNVSCRVCKQFNATGRRVLDRTRYACLNDAYGSVRGNS